MQFVAKFLHCPNTNSPQMWSRNVFNTPAERTEFIWSRKSARRTMGKFDIKNSYLWIFYNLIGIFDVSSNFIKLSNLFEIIIWACFNSNSATKFMFLCSSTAFKVFWPPGLHITKRKALFIHIKDFIGIMTSIHSWSRLMFIFKQYINHIKHPILDIKFVLYINTAILYWNETEHNIK